jgi:hypothetical protein
VAYKSQVIATTQVRTSIAQEVYVTDYTVHHDLYGGRDLARIMFEKRFDNLELALDIARGHRLALVSFFDAFADMAQNMRIGQFYCLRNLAMCHNNWGNLEGKVRPYKIFEAKDVQLLSSDSRDDEEFTAFLKCALLQQW